MSGPLRLRDLADPAGAVPLLAAAGLDGPVAEGRAGLFARCAAALAGAGVDGGAEVLAFFVPGRIEVLGKHTDYAGGRSLIAAAERGICLLAAPRPDAGVRLHALDVGGRCEFALSAGLRPTVGCWSNYPMTVARRVARNFPGRLRGADVAYCGDLPVAAGMSSSSAVMVANFLALSAVNDLPARGEYRREIACPEDLAGYLGTVENGQDFGSLAGDRGVGTFGGSEDHVAMLCSEPGRVSRYAYCPIRLERRAALPAGWVFAVASSGVVAEKTGEAMARYNRASALARRAVEAWNRATGRSDPHLAAALAAGGAERLGACLDEPELRRRFEHFYLEDGRLIGPATDALERGDLAEFGRLVGRSQRGAEELLGNQVPETVHLARTARELGAAAASAFGAGFGGSVWALVRREEGEAFCRDWLAEYAAAFPRHVERANVFLTGAGGPAVRIGGGF